MVKNVFYPQKNYNAFLFLALRAQCQGVLAFFLFILSPFQIISHFNFLESQSIPSLTKVIERITKIHDIKWIYYKNIINEKYNSTYLIL
jgi:hypothetical protein